MDITLAYNANGGDSTPASETKTVPGGATSVDFTLADAITKNAPTGKYRFVKWMVGDVAKNPGETITLDADAIATAVFEIVQTTVSPKAYGWSPNGTKNALGTTKFRHQPNYPRPMGS